MPAVADLRLATGFDAFFRNPSNVKAIYRPPPGAVPQENHAVLLVGYDNDNDPPFWLARNSWGIEWGDGGLFRVRWPATDQFPAQTATAALLSPAGCSCCRWHLMPARC